MMPLSGGPLSLLVVNYRTASLAVEAIRSARDGTNADLHVIVVDNSCDAREADLLRSHADDLVVSATNRGYSGAINDGRSHVRGEVMIVSNPDVRFAPGALDGLAATLDRRTAVAGPMLHWDAAGEWLLPPADLHTTPERVSQVLATRASQWRAVRDRKRFLARVAFWSAREPVHVGAISGAVMAIRTDAFDTLGGFDERFPLYFEETDFLRRAASARLRTVYVPAARCQHVYDQSASQDRIHASAAYAESEMRYLEKWSGPWMARTLKSVERLPSLPEPQRVYGPVPVTQRDVLVEIAATPMFDTAAGHFPRTDEVDIPPDAWASFRGDALYIRVVERASGRVIDQFVRYKD